MMTIERIRKEIKRERRRGASWTEVGVTFGVTSGMAWRIANDNYEPKDSHVRARLHLPSLVPAPACPKCGDVHVTKRCTKDKRSRDLFGTPVKELARQLLERR